MGGDRGVGPLARIGSGINSVNVQPCGLEETEEEAASRSNTAGELAQNRWQVIRGNVNDGIPLKNCGCVSVSDPEIAQ